MITWFKLFHFNNLTRLLHINFYNCIIFVFMYSFIGGERLCVCARLTLYAVLRIMLSYEYVIKTND